MDTGVRKVVDMAYEALLPVLGAMKDIGEADRSLELLELFVIVTGTDDETKEPVTFIEGEIDDLKLLDVDPAVAIWAPLIHAITSRLVSVKYSQRTILHTRCDR